MIRKLKVPIVYYYNLKIIWYNVLSDSEAPTLG